MFISHMELNKLYFYTATVIRWHHLLRPDKYKNILIESLKYLVERKKIALYGFVIMPNHIHLLWEMLEKNGNEMPYSSFMKYTSHQIRKDLLIDESSILRMFKVDSSSREYQFWKRNSLPVLLYTPKIVYQKLTYIHNNPCQGNWMLAPSPIDYKYSSALFYETGDDRFGLLSHIGDRL